ncbi:MAG: NYN domain-containing protein [Bacteroidetes bacterium]|nr:NYN domain-containing protein [Bacteroidota bacterium]MBU2586460.1 NYN domain-containing protein [Bacteroidota bacterium]
MEIQYLFVDGGCLRETLADYSLRFFDGDKIEFDYERLGREYQKVFYYDSPPPKNSDEKEAEYQERITPELEFFSQLNLLDGFHVYEGISRRRRKKVEQKKVDIMIAVDMLNHSFRKNMSKATLLTSDLDFKPLIEALVDNGMYINLWYPLNRTNIELIQSADSSKKLDLHAVYDYCTPSFKQSHYIPKGSNKIGQDLFNVTKIGDIKNRFGIEGEIFKANDRLTHYLLFKTYYNEKAYTHLEFENIDKLKAYFDEYSYPNQKV